MIFIVLLYIFVLQCCAMSFNKCNKNVPAKMAIKNDMAGNCELTETLSSTHQKVPTFVFSYVQSAFIFT